MRVVNDLLGYKNLKIVQDTNYFSFSLDSVLIANFATLNKNTKKILDIGTGNAPIPLILTTKTDAQIFGFEIQKEIYDMALESLNLNNNNSQITLINDDIKNIADYFNAEEFDTIITNPPYFKFYEFSKLNIEEKKAIARHEITLDLKSILSISFKYLKNNGNFAMVYRTERLTEVLSLMSEYRLEPKKITFIYPKHDSSSNLFLVEGIKNAKNGLKEVKSLIVHDNNGNYTKEVKKYFN